MRASFLLACAAWVALLSAANGQEGLLVFNTTESGDWFTTVTDNVFAWPALGSTCVNGNNVATFAAFDVFDQTTNGFSDITWEQPFVAGTGAPTAPSTTFCRSNGEAGKTTGYTLTETGEEVWTAVFDPPVGAVAGRWYADSAGTELFVRLESGTIHNLRANVTGTGIDEEEIVGVVTTAGDLITGFIVDTDNGASINNFMSGLWIGSGTKDCDAALATVVPTLQSSEITGERNLDLEFTAWENYTTVGWEFQGASAACNDPSGSDENGWTYGAASGCIVTHGFSMPLTQALASCNFGAIQTGANGLDYYETVLEATTVRPVDDVFGDGQTRTDVTSFRLRVEFPTSVAVNGSAEVFGPLIDQSALTEQTFDSVTQEFGWNLATSVQYPYYLEPVSTAVSGGHMFDTLPVVASDGTCAAFGTDAAPAACRQDFALSANETDDCLVPAGTTVTVTFQILCRPQYAGSCDLPEGNTTTASFSVETDNFCPQVVEVASITPSLTTYAGSAGGTVSTNYILETTLFGRVTADVEAGLQAKRTTLTGLDIVSSCTDCDDDTVQPFTDGLPAAATDYDFVWEDGGRVSTAAGEVQTDFSFTLNTNSLSFDSDASTGEAQITLTAYVSVEYDTPSAQGLQRSYRAQAVTGPGSIGSSASANFGVSSAPAGTTGGSSSTAGSTVLGVSTGTAALAAVGLAAVAAIAFGAAVAARRRRRAAPAKRLSSSSSSSSAVELGLPASTEAMPSMPTDSLSTVQAAYSATV